MMTVWLCSLSMAAKDVVQLTWSRKGVRMQPSQVEGLDVDIRGGHIDIHNCDTTRELRFVLSGQSTDGGITYHGKYRTTFTLAGLELQNTDGCAMDIKCGKRVAIKLKSGTHNVLTDSPDTLHRAVIYCKGHLELSGHGALTLNARGGHGVSTKEYIMLKQSLGTLTVNATGDGCKGIRTAADFLMHGGNVRVITTGNYLALDTTSHFPPFPGMGEGEFSPEQFDSLMQSQPFGHPMGDGQPPFGQMQDPDFMAQHPMPQGGFPPHHEMSDSLFMGPHPDMGQHPEAFPPQFMSPDSLGADFPFHGPMDGDMGMPPMRPSYIGTTKAIKALGHIVVDGGTLTVETCSPGAEGLEGKQGVTLSGGNISVKAHDDAINSGGKIVFSGATVSAVSTNNDAVDSNAWAEGAITISDGQVEVFSGAGPPEEGFDCDESPICISGGEAMSVGSGMGPWPSMPNEMSATQAYVLFQGVTVERGNQLSVCNDSGLELLCITSPVSNPYDCSLVTSPKMQSGQTYTLKVNGTPVSTAVAQ